MNAGAEEHPGADRSAGAGGAVPRDGSTYEDLDARLGELEQTEAELRRELDRLDGR